MNKITEQDSHYNDLEKMSVLEIIEGINSEDQKVALAVRRVLPDIARAIETIYPRIERGGRLFYIGAGTSGRLGVVDASECPPTFGVPFDLVVGLIAGGDKAIRKAVEFAEDDVHQAIIDLRNAGFNEKDTLVGIAASGTTPYVLGGIMEASRMGVPTIGISCNPDSPLSQLSDIAIEPVVGPEFLTGSTRMKSGTAQKMVLNMISTSVMIKLGKVKGNKMVDMKISNQKLVNRALKTIMQLSGMEEDEAQSLLDKHGSVRAALDAFQKGKTN